MRSTDDQSQRPDAASSADDRPPPEDRQPTLIDPARAVTDQLPALDRSGSSDRRFASQPPVAGTVVSGRYELVDVLGRGATSTVWRARDASLHRDVALKVLHPDLHDSASASERFRREGLVAAGLDHPGIVRVFDAGVDAQGQDLVAYVVLEVADGQTLAQRLAGGPPLTPDQVVTLGQALLDALAHAHGRGVVHRDIKPGNVLSVGGGDVLTQPRLADFGVAKAALADHATLTTTGTILGTAAYLAPEQALGEKVDHRADLYALGCVLYECVTGRQPFTGDNPVQVAAARIEVQLRPSQVMGDIPEALDHAIAVAMHPHVEGRWADAAAMRRALTDVEAAAPHEDSGEPDEALVTTQVLRRPVEDETTPSPATDRASGQSSRAGGGGLLGRLLLAATLVVGVLLIARLVSGGFSSDQQVADEAQSPEPGAAAEAGEGLAVASAAAFDPEGDGDEHGEDAGLVADGDPATEWQTEGYNSEAFGNLKSGVGVVLDLGEATDVRALALHGVTEGTSLQVRASSERPQALEDTRVVATLQPGGGTELALEGAEGVRYLLVWIVPPLPDDGGRFRAVIAEARPLA